MALFESPIQLPYSLMYVTYICRLREKRGEGEQKQLEDDLTSRRILMKDSFLIRPRKMTVHRRYCDLTSSSLRLWRRRVDPPLHSSSRLPTRTTFTPTRSSPFLRPIPRLTQQTPCLAKLIGKQDETILRAADYLTCKLFNFARAVVRPLLQEVDLNYAVIIDRQLEVLAQNELADMLRCARNLSS